MTNLKAHMRLMFFCMAAVTCDNLPVDGGYDIAAGDIVFGTVRDVTCASGFSGSASAIECMDTGLWTGLVGCSGMY